MSNHDDRKIIAREFGARHGIGGKMKPVPDEKIDKLYLETTSGFYLAECAKNAGPGSGEEGFLKNQLSEFRSGFRCAENLIGEAVKECVGGCHAN